MTRVRLFGDRCACCGKQVSADAPTGLESRGSPFGHSIAAMVVYLHYAHAIGMERLALLMDELFSLSISEGAISNIMVRARAPLLNRNGGDPGGGAGQLPVPVGLSLAGLILARWGFAGM